MEVKKPKKKPVARRVFSLTELGKKAAKIMEETNRILGGGRWTERDNALWNFIRAVAGRNNIPAEEVERDIEKAIRAVRSE